MPFSPTAYPLPSLLPQGANQNRFFSQGQGYGEQSWTKPGICPHSRPYLSNSQSSKAPSPLLSNDFIPADLIGKTTSPQLALDSLQSCVFASPSLGDSNTVVGIMDGLWNQRDLRSHPAPSLCSCKLLKLLSFIFGEGNGNPLQYSCLENPMDGGVWWAAVHGVTKSQTRLKRLSSSSSFIYFIQKNRYPHTSLKLFP